MEGKLPEPYLKVQGHTDIITAVAVDAASGCVYSASVDGTVRVVDLETGDLRFEVRVGEPILSMALTDSHHLLLGCSSGRVQAYETEKGLYLLSIICHKSNVTAIDFWDESQTLVTGDSSGNIRLWSFKDSSFLGALPQHDAAVMSLQIDSSKVVSAARDGCVAVSILDKLERKYSIVGFTKYLSSVAFDQARLIADGTNNIIVCHRFDSDANEIT